MDRYAVTGMSCAACSARIEKAVSCVSGVKECSVSLLTNSMSVEGQADPEKIIEAVEKAGYGAVPLSAFNKTQSVSLREQEELLRDKETPVLKRRLFWSLGFLSALMYVSMGNAMAGFPLPEFMAVNPAASGLLQLLLSALVMIICQKFFISGFRSMVNLAPNMDALVALGSGVSFIYSTFSLFCILSAQAAGNYAAVKAASQNLYFDGAAMILALITLGKLLESVSKGRTTDAIKGLLKLAPKTAFLLKEGKETAVPADKVQTGDIFAVKPGGSIPADGVIIEGITSVDESMLTGESIPAYKQAGSKVSAATTNISGYIKCRALRTGSETAIAQIIRMVSEAAATKAPIAKAADKIAGFFVPAVIIISVITVTAWLASGQSWSFALSRGISVLVVSCPCALGLATPAAIMAGSGAGARRGILFKTASVLEQAGKIKIVAMDKTGTITKGEPETTDVIVNSGIGISEDEFLKAAFSLERGSEHPLAKAVAGCCRKHKISETDLTGLKNFKNFPGGGLCAETEQGVFLYGGSIKFIEEYAEIPPEILTKAEELSKEGKTAMAFAKAAKPESMGHCAEKSSRPDGKFLGIIAAADAIRPDSAFAVHELQRMGIKVIMLTGDNEYAAHAIGRQAGVDEVIANILPEGKEAALCRLKEQHGRNRKENYIVAMAGDGINDAPALARADIGIAIGAGTDIAIDAAEIVLMNSSLADVSAAIRLSRATLRNIYQNLFWAFLYNAALIPVAAGVYYNAFGLTLNPMLSAAAMSLSSFCVVINALRLNFWGMESRTAAETGFAEREKTHEFELCTEKEKTMTKIYKIEGMMCGHCEMHVKKAVEAIEGVEEASASHIKGELAVKASKEIPAESIKKAVTDAGYAFIGLSD